MLQRLHIESSLSNIHAVENVIDSITGDTGIKQDNYGKILIATLEAVNNAIVHGNRSDTRKFVDIEILLNNNNLVVTVTDEGNGFRPKEVPDPTKPENIEAINGRGIFLMRKLADEIKYNRKGNRVKMIFKNIKH
jgi:serine/threonine-protein kinase RsbW